MISEQKQSLRVTIRARLALWDAERKRSASVVIREKLISLKEWRDNLIVETEGQKVAYVVDNIFSPENTKQILSLAHNADLFYCEAAFAHKDEGKARERYHLTSTQAGELARIAQAKRFIPFHFSRRYEREPNLLLDEALKAFAQA